jgi:hypothetical protein
MPSPESRVPLRPWTGASGRRPVGWLRRQHSRIRLTTLICSLLLLFCAATGRIPFPPIQTIAAPSQEHSRTAISSHFEGSSHFPSIQPLRSEVPKLRHHSKGTRDAASDQIGLGPEYRGLETCWPRSTPLICLQSGHCQFFSCYPQRHLRAAIHDSTKLSDQENQGLSSACEHMLHALPWKTNLRPLHLQCNHSLQDNPPFLARNAANRVGVSGKHSLIGGQRPSPSRLIPTSS